MNDVITESPAQLHAKFGLKPDTIHVVNIRWFQWVVENIDGRLVGMGRRYNTPGHAEPVVQLMDADLLFESARRHGRKYPVRFVVLFDDTLSIVPMYLAGHSRERDWAIMQQFRLDPGWTADTAVAFHLKAWFV